MNHSVISADGRQIEISGKNVYVDGHKIPYVPPKFFDRPTCVILGFALGLAVGLFLMGGFVIV